MIIWDLLLAVPIRQLMVTFKVFFVFLKNELLLQGLIYANLHRGNPINLFQNFTCFHVNINWQGRLTNSS